MSVEAASIPEVVFGASQAGMSGFNRPRQHVVPTDRRAGVVSDRSLAADFVEAVAEFGADVVEFFNELAGIEVSAAITLVVVALAVEHLRTELSVNRRQAVICQHVGDDAGHDFRDRGAARYADNRLIFDDICNRNRFCRIRFGGVDAAPGRAGAPGDNSFGAFGNVHQFFKEGFAAGQTEHAVSAEAGRSFNSQDVVAVEFLHDVFEGLVILFTGSDHQCVVVGQRNHRKDNVFGQRMVRTNERFSTAGAFQAVEPDNRSTWFSFHRVGDVRCAVCTESEGSGCQRAEFKETAS